MSDWNDTEAVPLPQSIIDLRDGPPPTTSPHVLDKRRERVAELEQSIGRFSDVLSDIDRMLVIVGDASVGPEVKRMVTGKLLGRQAQISQAIRSMREEINMKRASL